MKNREFPDPTALEIRDIEQAKGVHLSWDDEEKRTKLYANCQDAKPKEAKVLIASSNLFDINICDDVFEMCEKVDEWEGMTKYKYKDGFIVIDTVFSDYSYLVKITPGLTPSKKLL